MEQHPNSTIRYIGHEKALSIYPFAFVRNPYDRLVSTYFYLTSKERTEPVDIAYGFILKRYRGFKKFVLSIEKHKLTEVVLHLRPMAHWVCDEEGTLLAHILKVEDSEEIDRFLSAHGIPGWSDCEVKNSSTHGDYQSYLDETIIAEINKIYAIDFDTFNYQRL